MADRIDAAEWPMPPQLSGLVQQMQGVLEQAGVQASISPEIRREMNQHRGTILRKPIIANPVRDPRQQLQGRIAGVYRVVEEMAAKYGERLAVARDIHAEKREEF